MGCVSSTLWREALTYVVPTADVPRHVGDGRGCAKGGCWVRFRWSRRNTWGADHDEDQVPCHRDCWARRLGLRRFRARSTQAITPTKSWLGSAGSLSMLTGAVGSEGVDRGGCRVCSDVHWGAACLAAYPGT